MIEELKAYRKRVEDGKQRVTPPHYNPRFYKGHKLVGESVGETKQIAFTLGYISGLRRAERFIKELEKGAD